MKPCLRLATLAAALVVTAAGAATREELVSIEAVQRPGSAVVCSATYTPPGQTRSLLFITRAQVTARVNGQMHARVQDVYASGETPYIYKTYTGVSTLEETRQKVEVDPDSIRIRFPSNPAAQPALEEDARRETVSYVAFDKVRLLSPGKWVVEADPANGNPVDMQCAQEAPGDPSAAWDF